MTAVRTRAAVLATSAVLVSSGLTAFASQASATVPACGNAALAVSHTAPQGATGHGAFVLLFRNVSHSACSIFGYPGLDAQTTSGRVLAHARRTLSGFAGGAHAVTTVTVRPGHYASATVEWLNFNPVTSGACRFSSYVATTPANTTHTVRFPVSVSVCGLQVHPTVSGTSGRG